MRNNKLFDIRRSSFVIGHVRPSSLKAVPLGELAGVVRQLATLLKAGMPLLGALEILAGEAESETGRDALQSVRDRLKRGDALSQALKASDGRFPVMLANLAASGEMSGQLELVLEKYAGFLEQQEDMRQRLRGMLVYPALLMALGLASIVFLMVFVIPRFVGLFQEYGQQLPWLTRYLLSASLFLRQSGGWVLVGALAAWWLWREWIRTPEGNRVWMAGVFALPIMGPLLMKREYSRFSLVVATLVGGGIPVIQALEAVKPMLQHPALAEELDTMVREIQRGKGLAEALKGAKHFPPLMSRMLVVGEETGKPEDMLTHLHGYYERAVDRGLRTAMSLVEPVLVVAMGGVIGVMVMAILLPILSLGTMAR